MQLHDAYILFSVFWDSMSGIYRWMIYTSIWHAWINEYGDFLHPRIPTAALRHFQIVILLNESFFHLTKFPLNNLPPSNNFVFFSTLSYAHHHHWNYQITICTLLNVEPPWNDYMISAYRADLTLSQDTDVK